MTSILSKRGFGIFSITLAVQTNRTYIRKCDDVTKPKEMSSKCKYMSVSLQHKQSIKEKAGRSKFRKQYNKIITRLQWQQVVELELLEAAEKCKKIHILHDPTTSPTPPHSIQY